MIVQLKKDVSSECIPSGLSPRRRYLVLEISLNDYRLIDDNDDPVLYESSLFDIVDPQVPIDWIFEYDEDGDVYAQPDWLSRYVWEDYHDDMPEAVEEVRKYLAQIGPCSWSISDDSP